MQFRHIRVEVFRVRYLVVVGLPHIVAEVVELPCVLQQCVCVRRICKNKRISSDNVLS